MGKRKEWVKSTEQVVGDWGSWQIEEKYRQRVNYHMIGFFRRLVSCKVYSIVRGHIDGKVYSPSTINIMAKDGKLNYFKFSGIMFILMTEKEYDVYLMEIQGGMRQKEFDSDWRRELLKQPKNSEESEFFRKRRDDAVLKRAMGEYQGEEWDRFFDEDLANYKDITEADSIGMWLAQSGYYVNARSEKGIRTGKMVRVGKLWAKYTKWCEKEGIKPKYVKTFSLYLADVGFVKRFVKSNRCFQVFVHDKGKVVDMSDVMWLEKEKDEVWLRGVEAGEYEAQKLFLEYYEWCTDRRQQPLGKFKFYTWLSVEGWGRETRSGVVWVSTPKQEGGAA